jgi:methylmalonyl-CoA/ethylmalonyl-CoA epimerase
MAGREARKRRVSGAYARLRDEYAGGAFHSRRARMRIELSSILQIGIPAKDIERATAFYRDKLDLQFLMNGPNMAFFNCGGVRLYADANKGVVDAGGNTLIYFRSGNIEREHSLLKERGVKIHQEPHVIASLPDRDIWLMWIRDSEENLLGIMEERKKQTA